MITQQVQHEMGFRKSYYLLNVMVVNHNAGVCLLLGKVSENGPTCTIVFLRLMTLDFFLKVV